VSTAKTPSSQRITASDSILQCHGYFSLASISPRLRTHHGVHHGFGTMLTLLLPVSGWLSRGVGTHSPHRHATSSSVSLEGIDCAAEYTFVDSCAGAGGPTPHFEKYINSQLKASGHTPISFILTDWAPYVQAWQSLAEQSANISYIEKPIDAAKAVRVAEPGKRECRIFNLCFHHFDDSTAEEVLRSAVESTDAFV